MGEVLVSQPTDPTDNEDYWYPVDTTELTPRLDLAPELEALLDEKGEDSAEDPPWRKHFAQLDADDQREVVSYCQELDCLHQEFRFILAEMDQSVQALYSDSLHLKRLSLIYHTDNFYLRVHAYRERVFRLINHFFGLKVSGRQLTNNSVLEKLRGLGRPELVGLLGELERDRMFSRAMWLRNRLAHGPAERDWRGHWPSLEARARIDDVFFGRSEISALDRVTDLDRAHDAKQESLGALRDRLEKFRNELVAMLQSLAYQEQRRADPRSDE
jgi:hypothetical protein